MKKPKNLEAANKLKREIERGHGLSIGSSSTSRHMHAPGMML